MPVISELGLRLFQEEERQFQERIKALRERAMMREPDPKPATLQPLGASGEAIPGLGEIPATMIVYDGTLRLSGTWGWREPQPSEAIMCIRVRWCERHWLVGSIPVEPLIMRLNDTYTVYIPVSILNNEASKP